MLDIEQVQTPNFLREYVTGESTEIYQGCLTQFSTVILYCTGLKVHKWLLRVPDLYEKHSDTTLTLVPFDSPLEFNQPRIRAQGHAESLSASRQLLWKPIFLPVFFYTMYQPTKAQWENLRWLYWQFARMRQLASDHTAAPSGAWKSHC